MKLLLFDIDGTLLRTNHVGRRAFEEVLSELCGRPISTERTSFSGKTDPQIMREVLLHNGLSPSEAEEVLPDALDAYTRLLRVRLSPSHVEVLPGVRTLLDHLARLDAVHLALLTGNLEPTAYLKLEAADLAHHFPFGAFGSDYAERRQLPQVALRRARHRTGRDFVGKNLVIIGDTEHDICCGRHLDAFAVGVCTGHYDRTTLAAHTPDVLLDDLSDLDLFVNSVLNRVT